MADNKPALFPITAFIVSYHYARSDGLYVTRVTAYDLFIATPPSPPHTYGRNALYTLAPTPATRNPLPHPLATFSFLPHLPSSSPPPCYHHRIRDPPPFHLSAVVNTRRIFLHRGNGVVRMDRM